jgi:outer membrane protein OmpA-like peptidoglycan-associated protein
MKALPKLYGLFISVVVLYFCTVSIKGAEKYSIKNFTVTPGFTMVSLISIQKNEIETLKQLETKDINYIWTYSDQKDKNIKIIFESTVYTQSGSFCLFSNEPLKSNETYSKKEMWWFLPCEVFQNLKQGDSMPFKVVGYEFIKNPPRGASNYKQKIYGKAITLLGNGVVGVNVNGENMNVPVKIIKTDTGTTMYVIDNPNAPVVVKWSSVDGRDVYRLSQLVIPSMKENITETLKETGRAKVYGIFFNFGSADLREESNPILKEIGTILKKNPGYRLRIEGHTDNVGNSEFNKILSRKRAESVKSKIIEMFSIEDARIETEGYGSSKPVLNEDSIEARAQNRRVEIVKLN